MWSVVLLSIDPGVHGCGVALFHDSGPPEMLGQLHEANYAEGVKNAQRSEAWITTIEAVRVFVGYRPVTQLVVELPQVYVQARSKGDPNDLINLAAVVGGLCEAYKGAQQRIYLPAEWKGQTPKGIVHERMLKRLSAEEAAQISCRRNGLLHNVHDAVALGLFSLRRM